MQDNLIVFPEHPPDDTARLVMPALPVSLTQLVGREHEVKAIQALLLRPDVRLLTLTGTAGVGKTRLAFEVARDLVHDFADGVYVVSLAPISDPDLVIPTIAHSLGLMESGSQPVLDLLKLSQRDKQRLLLLDNFEQVIEAAPLLTRVVGSLPRSQAPGHEPRGVAPAWRTAIRRPTPGAPRSQAAPRCRVARTRSLGEPVPPTSTGHPIRF